MQGATEGQVSPPERVQYDSYYIKETLVLEGSCSLSVALFFYHAHLPGKVLLTSSTVSHSFCSPACDRGDACDVPRLLLPRLFMSLAPDPPLISNEPLSCCRAPRAMLSLTVQPTFSFSKQCDVYAHL